MLHMWVHVPAFCRQQQCRDEHGTNAGAAAELGAAAAAERPPQFPVDAASHLLVAGAARHWRHHLLPFGMYGCPSRLAKLLAVGAHPALAHLKEQWMANDTELPTGKAANQLQHQSDAVREGLAHRWAPYLATRRRALHACICGPPHVDIHGCLEPAAAAETSHLQ